jgi:spermidine synthase
VDEGATIVPGDRPGTFVLRMSGMDQSQVDLDDPTRLGFDYVRRLADAIDLHKPAGEPVRVVHVGGAAMSLPRYVAMVRPRSAQVVLEPDVEVTELVRERLPLPRHSGIKVRPVDGRTGVAALRDGYAELVVLDAFADARVPGGLVTSEFYADVARVLGPSGRLLANFTDRAPFAWTRRAVAGLSAVFGDLVLSVDTTTLRGRRYGNLVVVAGDAPLPVQGLRDLASRSATPYRVLDAGEISDRFGGGTPFTEADTEPSPPPPDR